MLLGWTHPSQRDHGLGFLISQYKKIREEQAEQAEQVNGQESDRVPKSVSERQEEQMRALKAHYEKGLELSLLGVGVRVSITGHKRKAGERDGDSETEDSSSDSEGGDDDSDEDYEDSTSENEDSDEEDEPIRKSTRKAIRINLATDLSRSLLHPKNAVRRSGSGSVWFGSTPGEPNQC